MKKRFEDIKYIYAFSFAILAISAAFMFILFDASFIDATKYYFFLAGRYKQTHQYTGGSLEIKALPESYRERPSYIFKNKLLFLYYGYTARLQKTFSPQYKVSFDVYPERFFKKIYQLDGKIISFEIEALRSANGVYSLEYKLDLSSRNACAAKFIFKSDDGKIINVTDEALKKEFFIPFIHKMRFEIVSGKGDISFYINHQLVSRALTGNDTRMGLFNLIKFPGSQFQMDNLIITDLNTLKDTAREDFNKSVNFFDAEDWFLPHQRIFFIIMLFALVMLGCVFDMCLAYMSELFRSETLWLEFIIPQALFLLTVNILCSLSLEPGFCAVFIILGAKLAYTGLCIFKRKACTE